MKKFFTEDVFSALSAQVSSLVPRDRVGEGRLPGQYRNI